jgi:calcineurin-like phosphoesterase
VEVLNGTAINGLAGRTAEMLRSFGYDVISIGNADRNNYETTEIIHRLDDESMVKAFAEIIRCGNIRGEAQMQGAQEDEVTIRNYEY